MNNLDDDIYTTGDEEIIRLRKENASLLALNTELVKMLKAVKISLIDDEHYAEFKILIHNIDKILEQASPPK